MASAGTLVQPLDCGTPAEVPPLPYGDMPQSRGFGAGVDPVRGYFSTGGMDLPVIPGKGIGLVAARTYTSFDAVAGHTGPFGYGWTWAYGARAVTHADGSVSIIEGGGRRALFWKDGAAWTPAPGVNALLEQVMGGGYKVTTAGYAVWTFDASGKLTAVKDRNQNEVTITYAGANPTTITAPGGRQLTITVDGSGRITQIAGPASLTATYTYDGSGNLATATDAAGKVTRYTYDARHQLTKMEEGTAAAGYRVLGGVTYGTLGRASQATAGGILDRFGALVGWLATTSYAFGYQGYSGSYGTGAAGASVVTDPRGTPIWMLNDAALRILQTEVYTFGQGGALVLLERRQQTYDANNNLLTTTDPNSRVTTQTYDSANPDVKARGNRLTTTVDSGAGGLGLLTSSTYNATNDVLTVTDPLGRTTTMTYDTAGNLLTVRNPLGQGPTYTYDSAGRRLTAIDATMIQTGYSYNTSGDLTTVAEPGSLTWTYAYDAAGRRTSTTNPLNQTTTSTYDGMGRVVTVTDPLTTPGSHTTTSTYDAYGNTTRVTDALGRQTNYEYDQLHRLTKVTDALANPTTYTYDASGNRLTTTNALGKTWTTTYDRLGRVLTSADPLGNTTTSTYDAAGALTGVAKPNGATITTTYDRVYRRTGLSATMTPSSGNVSVTWAYDAASRRTSMTDAIGGNSYTTTYSYDNANRLTSVASPRLGTAPLQYDTVGYEYDGANRLTKLTYPSTNKVTYLYNSRGLLWKVSDWQSKVTAYTYDPAGRLATEQLPNGQPASTRVYDAAGRLVSQTHTALVSMRGTVVLGLSSTYDNAGNLLTANDTEGTPPGTTTYAYDALERLTSETFPDAAVTSYTYDGAGNRLTRTAAGATTTYTYDDANRMTAAGSTTYGYDANGNQTSQTIAGTTTTYAYDALDRLIGVGSAAYTYNGDGARVAKAGSGTTEVDVWATVFGMPQILSDGASEYVWGRTLIAQVPVAGAGRYGQANGLDSVSQLTDGSGNVVGTGRYDAYGIPRTVTGAQAGFGYNGQRTDSESGLIYLRARYYNPSTGRFLSRDPLQGNPRNPQTLHAYVYAIGNPLRYVDPTGKAHGEMGGGLAAPGGGAVGGGAGLGAVRLAVLFGVGIVSTPAALSSIPDAARGVLDWVRGHNGSPPPGGYAGGGPFANRDGRLPPGDYVEYDVDNSEFGRSDRRIVIDRLTGKAYYTDDHYETFIPIPELDDDPGGGGGDK